MNNELRIALKRLNEMIGNIDLDLLENLGELTNLKLHQVNHMFYKMEDFEGIFTDFCIYEYENFEEMLKENNLMKTHIGHTSSFYLEHENFDLFSLNYASDFEGKSHLDKLELLILNEINQLFDMNDFEISALEIVNVNSKVIDSEDIDSLRKELEETMNILASINEVYEYIENFKEKQCEYFVEFMNFNI